MAYKDPEKYKAYQRQYQADNRDRLNQRARDRYAANPTAYLIRNRNNYRANHQQIKEGVSRYQTSHRDQINEYARKTNAKLRATIFRRYGEQCACCGVTEKLTIDHINGDGKQHREEIGNLDGIRFYRWLLRMYLPDGYQTLCSYCNLSKRQKGRCTSSHEPTRKKYAWLREIIFRRYGESCACCGATGNLTIDHLDGDGKQHREETGNLRGIRFYRWLLLMYLPGGYQTLCARCNTSKKRGSACRLNHHKSPT
jgi:hypothetical protein